MPTLDEPRMLLLIDRERLGVRELLPGFIKRLEPIHGTVTANLLGRLQVQRVVLPVTIHDHEHPVGVVENPAEHALSQVQISGAVDVLSIDFFDR